MAGTVDLLLYGIAIFISPVAVYFKKGVGAQFWVNCCLYCLLGIPGMLHAFYIIHTTKSDQKALRAPDSTYSPQAQQRYLDLPALPHPDRYRPAVPYSPYEGHPPPVPPKREENLPYDPALHPNVGETNLGRAKAILHTYRIPESTLHPPPLSRRRPHRVLSLEQPRLRPEPEADISLQLQPQPQAPSEPPPPPNSSHSGSTLPYSSNYHPNAASKNIANAKAVLHTYQIPETTFPAPEPQAKSAPETQKRLEVYTTPSKGKSMWSLRNRGKSLSALDTNPPAVIQNPGSTLSRTKWHTGPSWLHRRKNPGNDPIVTTTTDDEEGAATMRMVWNDRYDRLHPSNPPHGRTSGARGAHTRSTSEPMELPFPMPPGSVRPVIDRTGTSNAGLVCPGEGERGEPGLGVVIESSPKLDDVVLEGEEGRRDATSRWHASRKPEPSTDSETTQPQHRLVNRLSRSVRPRLDIIGGSSVPNSAPSAVPNFSKPPIGAGSPKPNSPDQNRGESPPLSRHIAPPAVLASSIEERRGGRGSFRGPHPRGSVSSVSPSSPTRNNVDFRFAELGLGRSGDAYSAGSRALRSNSGDQGKVRRASSSTVQGPVWSPKRTSTGTAGSPTSAAFTPPGSPSVPVIRRGLTQGTFGTGAGSSSEGGLSSAKVSKSEEHTQKQEPSPDQQIDRWIKREEERQSLTQSRSPTSYGHGSADERHANGPDTASLFSEESSGFAGVGVVSAQEKGRAGHIEIWDRPNWDGSDPSASPEPGSVKHHHAHYHEHDPFLDPSPSSNTHSSHATGRTEPLSPPTSPRPSHPNRPPPAVPQTPVQNKPTTLRMDTFGAGERATFGLLSPPATERVKGNGKERAVGTPLVLPLRPSASLARSQSPKIPPKPAILRKMTGGEEDDLSEVYARALRD